MNTSKLVGATAIAVAISLAACKRAPSPNPSAAPTPVVSASATTIASAPASATSASPAASAAAGPTDPSACGKGTATFTSSVAGCGFKIAGVSAVVLDGGRMRVSFSNVAEEVPEIVADRCEVHRKGTEYHFLWLDFPSDAKGKVNIEKAWNGPTDPKSGFASLNVFGKTRNAVAFADKGSITVTTSDGASIEGSFSFDAMAPSCSKPTKIEGTFKAKICCRATAY